MAPAVCVAPIQRLTNANSVQLRGFLGQTSIAHLDLAELALENAEGMFTPRPSACLHALEPLGQSIDRLGRAQQAAFTGSHGNVPGHVSLGIKPFTSTLVAGIRIDLLVAGPHQIVGLYHVLDRAIGGCRAPQRPLLCDTSFRSTTVALCGFASSEGRVRRCCSWSNWARQ